MFFFFKVIHSDLEFVGSETGGVTCFVSDMCHFTHIWLVQFEFEISNLEHNLPRSRLAMDIKLLRQWKQIKAKPLARYLKPRIDAN